MAIFNKPSGRGVVGFCIALFLVLVYTAGLAYWKVMDKRRTDGIMITKSKVVDDIEKVVTHPISKIQVIAQPVEEEKDDPGQNGIVREGRFTCKIDHRGVAEGYQLLYNGIQWSFKDAEGDISTVHASSDKQKVIKGTRTMCLYYKKLDDRESRTWEVVE